MCGLVRDPGQEIPGGGFHLPQSVVALLVVLADGCGVRGMDQAGRSVVLAQEMATNVVALSKLQAANSPRYTGAELIGAAMAPIGGAGARGGGAPPPPPRPSADPEGEGCPGQQRSDPPPVHGVTSRPRSRSTLARVMP